MISSISTKTRRPHAWAPYAWARGLRAMVAVATVVALTGVGATSPAQAEPAPVWRCEVAGRITYSDQPCKNVLAAATPAALTQREVQVADSRTPSQQAEAREAARAQERLVRQLQQERQQRERQWARPAPAVVIGLPPDPLARAALKPASKDRRKQPADRSAARTSPATAAASRRAPD
jgi:hypothetical protein